MRVLLSTCKWHLQLEGALHKLDAVHESFRLWITVEPHPAFPIGLLQMGIKVTNEAPVGMEASLRASYQWITQVGNLVPKSHLDFSACMAVMQGPGIN